MWYLLIGLNGVCTIFCLALVSPTLIHQNLVIQRLCQHLCTGEHVKECKQARRNMAIAHTVCALVCLCPVINLCVIVGTLIGKCNED